MKILHVYRGYYPALRGGIIEVMAQLGHDLLRRGVEARVFTLADKTTRWICPRTGMEVHAFKQDFEVASCGMSRAALRAFKGEAAWADIVHYHFPWPFGDVLHGQAGGRPSLVTYHSDVVRQKLWIACYRPLMGWFLGHVNAIAATSPQYVDSSPVLACYRDKVKVIPLGLDEAAYPRASPDTMAEWRSRVGGDFFLFLGVLRYYKGLEFLLEAAADAPYRVVIAGTGPMAGELRQMIDKKKLSNVSLVGEISEEDKAALLSLCRGVVFPSHLRSEAFGLALVEGAMFGRPLISTELGTGTSYVNLHEETGLVVPPTDVGALRCAMDRLWSEPARAEQMGRNARQRYVENFTAQRMADRYLDLYRKLLGDAAGMMHSSDTATHTL